MSKGDEYETEEESECAVCFCPTDDRVHPCGHIVCYACASRWVEKSVTCPVCRSTIVSTQTRASRTEAKRLVVVEFTDQLNDLVGITLENWYNRSVRIMNVRRQNLARKFGLRAGDIITHINNIPVAEHDTAISIIDTAQQHQLPLAFQLRVPVSIRATVRTAVQRMTHRCLHR